MTAETIAAAALARAVPGEHARATAWRDALNQVDAYRTIFALDDEAAGAILLNLINQDLRRYGRNLVLFFNSDGTIGRWELQPVAGDVETSAGSAVDLPPRRSTTRPRCKAGRLGAPNRTLWRDPLPALRPKIRRFHNTEVVQDDAR